MKRSILFLSLFLLSLVVLTSSVSAASWNKIQEVDVEIRNESWVQIQQVEVNLKPAAWYQIQVVEVELEQAQWVLVQTVEVELKHARWVLVQTVEVELEQAQWSLIQTVEVELEQARWVLIQTVEVNIVIPSGTLVWTGAGDDNFASNAENWNEGIIPYNGADVVFDGTSVKDCTWDIDASFVTVNSLVLATGYTGTLTQDDVDIGIGAGGFFQQDGVFRGNTVRYIYNDGDIVRTGGTIPGISTRWVMTGNDSMIYSTKYGYFNSLIINGHTTYNGTESDILVHRLEVNGQFTVDSRLRLAHEVNKKFTIDNKGIIDGLGVLELWITNVPPTLELGKIDCELRIASRTGDYQANLEGPATLNHLSVGVIGNNIITLDVYNQVVNVSRITIGERGAIVGDGTIINTGDLDASAGSFLFNGKYIQAGDGKITLAQGQKLNDLTVYVPVRLTLGSDITVKGELIGIKNIILNGYRLYFTGDISLGEYPSEFYVHEPVFIPIKTPVREALFVYGDIPRWMKYDVQKGGLYGVPVGTGLHDFNISCYSEYTDLASFRISFAILEHTIQKDDFRGQSIGSIISIILSIIVIGMCGITRGPDGKMEYQISNVLLGGAVVVSVLVFASVIPSYGLVIVAFLLFALYWGGRR